MTPVETLLATAERIRKLRASADDAVHIPTRRRGEATRIDIGNLVYRQSSETVAAMKTIQTRLGDELEAEGRAQRDAVITGIAAELESLRADLCNQAAAAAVELGAIARHLNRKANGQ